MNHEACLRDLPSRVVCSNVRIWSNYRHHVRSGHGGFFFSHFLYFYLPRALITKLLTLKSTHFLVISNHMTSQLSFSFDSDLSTIPQLPVRVSPIQDETRSSWLARLCQANAISVRILSQSLKNKCLLLRDFDRGAPPEALYALAKLSGLTTRVIEEMSLLYNTQHFLKYDSVYGTASFISSVSRTYTREMSRGISFCPDCLRDDPIPYFRKQWRYSFVTTCLKHKRLLIDHCPNCSEPFQHNFGNTGAAYYNREEMMRCAYCCHPINRNRYNSSDQKCAALLYEVTSSLLQSTEEHWTQFASSGQYIYCASWLNGIRLLLKFIFSGLIHHTTLDCLRCYGEFILKR